MKRTILKITVVALLTIVGLPQVVGQDTEPTVAGNTVHITTTPEILAMPNIVTGAATVVNHTPAIEALIAKKSNANLREAKGYRIQIFSGNRGTVSRNRAFEIKDIISDKEPTLDIYVTYTSPFWKVRLGNCATHEKAQSLRTWIIEQFPEFATETYIVPSQVLIP